jgi:hypothetical protein
MKNRILISLTFVLFLCSCQAVKPYERMYVDDQEMRMNHASSKNFNQYVHSIREGATPSSGSKSSGGCGCN